ESRALLGFCPSLCFPSTSLVPYSSTSAVARSLIISLRRGRSLILSIRGIARSPLYGACFLIVRYRNTLSPPLLHLGPPLHCFLSPLCSSSSPATLISVLLPPLLPLRPSLL
ncbi:hypothetical protein HN51_056370, partial [Arachis hypogaea]